MLELDYMAYFIQYNAGMVENMRRGHVRPHPEAPSTQDLSGDLDEGMSHIDIQRERGEDPDDPEYEGSPRLPRQEPAISSEVCSRIFARLLPISPNDVLADRFNR